MKTKHAFFSMAALALSLLASLPVVAAPVGRAYFWDRCAQLQTATAIENQVEGVVELFYLDRAKKVDVEISLSPVGDGAASGRVIRRQGVRPSSDGRFSERVALPREGARVWELRATWSQGTSAGERGSFSARVLRVRDDGERFFSLRSEPLCRRRASVELVSNYLANQEAHELRVGYDFPITPFPNSGGFDLGAVSIMTPTLASGPFLAAKPKGGWAFSGFESALGSSENFRGRIERLIPQGSGGYFVKVTRFERYKAREMKLLRKRDFAGCRNWVDGGDGYVDVPRVSYEFAFAPPETANDSEAARRLIDATLRPVEDCASEFPRVKSADPNFSVRGGLGEAPIFFYPL